MKKVINLVVLVLIFCLSTAIAHASVVNYSVQSASGDSWTGAFDVSNTTDPMKNDGNRFVTSITAGAGPQNSVIYFGSNGSGMLQWYFTDYSGTTAFRFNSLSMYGDMRDNSYSWTNLINKSGGYALDSNNYFKDNSPALTGVGGNITFSDPTAVPEPTTYALLCISLGVVAFARKRMSNKA